MTIRFVLNPQELSDLTTLLVDHEIWTRNSIDRKILDGSNFFLEVGSESFTRKLSFNNTRIDLIDPLQSWIVKIANQKFAEGYLLTREHD